MVEVELWDSIDGAVIAGEIAYRWLWTLRVDGNQFELRGTPEMFDPWLKIINLYQAPDFLGDVNDSLTFFDNPEMWARTLDCAFRSGYTIPYLVRDDDPPVLEEPEIEREEINLQQPDAFDKQIEALVAAQDEAILDGTAHPVEQELMLGRIVEYVSCDDLVERAREATAAERAAAPVLIAGQTASLTLGAGLIFRPHWTRD